MIDKIVLVTEPDDIVVDGFRILLVDLTNEQSQIISDAINKLNFTSNVIIYVANISSVEWLIDKKHKSKIIIFNADSTNELLTGYLAAQPNAYYIGNLKIFGKVNKRVIYSVDEVVDIINKTIGHYE